MSTNDLALLSDQAVTWAIVVYSLALVVLAVDAARRRVATPSRVPVPVAAGATPREDLDADTSDPSPAFLERLGLLLTAGGVLLHLAGFVTRGLAAGRVPWGNMYEFTLAFSLAAAATVVARMRTPAVRPLAVWVVGLVALALGLAATVLYAPAADLVPVLDSYWLVIHVAAAITAGGLFTLGFVACVAYLVRTRGGRESAASLDRLTYGATLAAFPIWTFAVIAGAIWAENAWGRYWGWDPKETWAFITWVCYAAYLHAQATPSWRGRRAAWLGVAGYAAFLFNFFGVNLWISGLHSYAGV